MDIYKKREGTSFDETGKTYGAYTTHSPSKIITGEALIGFNYFLTDNIAFNSSIGYNYNKYTITTTPIVPAGSGIVVEDTKYIATVGNVTWNFGLTITIARKGGNKFLPGQAGKS